MLRGSRVVLRRRLESDVAVLEAALRDDVATWSRIQSGPWYPVTLGETTIFAVTEPSDKFARFTVADPGTDEVLGHAALWGVDRHNGAAHVGMSLLEGSRGKGLGTEVVDLLCAYGFETLGLHRLALETLADNAAMVTVAVRAGFRHEGTLRETAWLEGAYRDEVLYGLLVEEWRAARADP